MSYLMQGLLVVSLIIFISERLIVLDGLKTGDYETKKEFWVFFLIPFYGTWYVLYKQFFGDAVDAYRRMR